VSLPTGAATSVLQTQISGQLPATLGAKTSAASLSIAPATDATFVSVGNVAPGATDSGNPVKVGGLANNALPTGVSAGQRVNAWFGLNGQQITAPNTNIAALADNATNSVYLIADYAGNSAASRSYPFSFNSIGWDKNRNLLATDMATGLGVQAIGLVPTSAASQGTPYTTVFGAATNVLKGSAGNLYGINVNNSTTAQKIK